MNWRTRWPERVERVLDDAVLGFLALLSLFLIFVPSVFELGPEGEGLVLAAEYGIIGAFALEYLAGFALAPRKRLFLTNPWRLIDALIIVAPLVALLPAVPELLRSAPTLRLLRLGRLALLGTRSGLALGASAGVRDVVSPTTATRAGIRALGATGEIFEAIGWEEGLDRIRNAEPDWLFVSGVAESSLAVIADALAVPEQALHGLFSSSIPRFDRLERFSALFVRYPLEMQPDAPLRRTPVLLVGSAENVVVLCRDQSDLSDRVEARLRGLPKEMPRLARATVALLGEIGRAYSEVIEALEVKLLLAEAEQATLTDEAFLARTFELRSDILRVRSSLRHLKNEMRDASFGELVPASSTADRLGLLGILAQNMEDLFESADDLRESLQALVDLRLNVASFQMNRVMRLLALLTALALIPATAGGLLGMNLLDTPWHATLAQVAFGVAGGMALSLYVFAIKGWLR